MARQKYVRKDYELIAKALASTRPSSEYVATNPNGYAHEYSQWMITRDAITHALQADNPRFDADRFREATNK